MKKFINKLPLLLSILSVTFYSCQQEENNISELQGTIRFAGISLDFEPMGSPGSRVTGNSPWIHVFPNSANLVFTNKVTKTEYVLAYNPNDFSVPYPITIPYGPYEYNSIVVGEIFSDFLPFEAKGEFILDSQSLEIILKTDTDYGLVTVKDQYVEKASITNGLKESDLFLHEDCEFWFVYVKGETTTSLKIKESFLGSTIIRELNIVPNKHYNFVLKLNEGSAVITDLNIEPFELEEEEILIGPNSKFFEENGTIKCPGAIPGEKGMVNDKIYEAVDRVLLIQRRDEDVDLSCVCTSLVSDMSFIFYQSSLVVGNSDISAWDVSNVTNMQWMFFASAFNKDISAWDVSNVTDMSNMFENTDFNQSIGNWDVSNVTNMENMFFSSGFNQPIGNWDVGNVINMKEMFGLASFNQPIGNWDVSSVTNMWLMFYSSKFNQPIGNWDVSSVTNMRYMFYLSDFNQPIGDWDIRKVTNLEAMFSQNPFFNQDIGNWNVSNVINMAGMFEGAQNFNQEIKNWNVSRVTNMGGMFGGSAFDKPIGDWDVSNVTNMGQMFAGTPFNQPIGSWDVSNVIYMGGMFHSSAFDKPIGDWDVSNVKNMSAMFWEAYSFNQSIGNWNVKSVVSMRSMFLNASSFNQDISLWCVQNIPSEPNNFSTNSPLIEANKPVWGSCPD